ncbi:MAG: 2-oxo acid dehydrogenase subunit E2 [Planctomycetes bacterium]|nr:2-oxo acid dehydrogenase subunit E2 [Planctomycetota bacterium]
MADITRPVPWPRTFLGDLLHFSRRVPAVTFERTFRLRSLRLIRDAMPDRPGWTALFVKGFARLASEFRDFRTSHIEYPWPRLVEHGTQVASVAVEKEIDGRPAVMFAKIRSPEARTLWNIDGKLRRAKECRLEELAPFRAARGLARLPRPVRRFLWWMALEWSARWRSRKFGTFGVSSCGMLGAESLNLLSPLTANLTFGPVSRKGVVRVRIVFDHRVCDGGVVARALARLEEIMEEEITAELKEQAVIPMPAQSPVRRVRHGQLRFPMGESD